MIPFDIKNYGYFDEPTQTEPKVVPEADICIICGDEWQDDTVRTISNMYDDKRCWFYRVHRKCHDQLNDNGKNKLDDLLSTYIEKSAKAKRPTRKIERIIDRLTNPRERKE